MTKLHPVLQRKRAARKRARTMTTSLTMYKPKFQSGIAAQQKVKLVYSAEAVRHDITGINVFLSNKYTINSLFDPRTAIGGHQPRYFDQWAAMYQRYRVTKCDVEVDIYNITPTGIGMVYIIPLPFLQSDTVDSQEALEYKHNTSRIVTDTKPVHLKRTFTVAQVEGVKQSVVDNDLEFSAGVGATPTRFPTFQVATSALKSGDSSSMVMRTRITYYATMYQPRDVGAS